MCGISGFLSWNGRRVGVPSHALIKSMTNALSHRGPDDAGHWTDDEAGIALGHRRLSIIDLSSAGRQPMSSASGRFVMVYNGEVYNHSEMRADLERRGIAFRGHSDTEVMLEAIETDGIEAAVSRFIGMFAIALWDRKTRCLTLIRDRLGIKPLYWSRQGDLFLFGSELKSLRAHSGYKPTIKAQAVAGFLRRGYVPAPATIYLDTFKLEPGTMLTLPHEGEPRITRYWSLREVAKAGLADVLDDDDDTLTDQLDLLLRDAVRKQMISDVPIGAFLSGGIDSSLVVALMKAADAGPVQTFSVGFEHSDYDESPHAAAVARYLGTEHTALTATTQHALDIIPRLPEWYDEPFADSSQIPTYLVSEMTRRHVTVALSGDGGDELFGGYNRHRWAERAHRLTMLPPLVRNLISTAMLAVPPQAWDAAGTIIPATLRPRQAGDKAHKFAGVLRQSTTEAVYRHLTSLWDPADAMVEPPPEDDGLLHDSTLARDFPNPAQRMQFLDMAGYLPDDILTKVDRASMAVALEARVPLLDHRVVAFSWRLPASARQRGGQGKWLLRRLLHRYVPPSLVERPKSGFAVPLGAWLRGPLRDWAEDLLEGAKLARSGLDETPIRACWNEHLVGRRNWSHRLWNVLMLEAWQQHWNAQSAHAPTPRPAQSQSPAP